MSQNIEQIYIANPTTSMASTDLLYLGRSPYNTSDDFAITFANFVGSIGSSVPLASTIAKWDGSANMSAVNFLNAFSTTVTAAGNTILLVSSNYFQYFTGSTTQTVTMPVTSGLALGQSWMIVNNSSGAVTINSSGGNAIQILAANTSAIVTCQLTSGTTAASWNASYISDAGGSVSSGTINQLTWYAATGNTVSGLATANSGMLVTSGAGVPSIAALSAGQIFIGTTGAAPTAAAINSGSGIIVANGSGSITVSATGGGVAWSSIAGTTQAAAVNTGYIVANAGQTTITLPATAAIGDTIKVRGLGAAGWILAANSGQTIKYITATTSSGGSLTSAEQYDNIEVTCIVANTTWTVAYAATTGLTVA